MTSTCIRRALAVTALATSPALLLAPNALASTTPAHHHALTKRQAEAILRHDARYVTALSRLEQKTRFINGADKASLKAATSAEKAAIGADLAAVKAGSSSSAYTAAVKAAGLTTAEAGLDYGTVLAADGTEFRDAALNKTAAKLEAKAKAASATGAEALLAKVAGHTATANKDANAAVAAVLALPASPTAKQLRTASRAAFTDLFKARKAQFAAAVDIAKAKIDLRRHHHS